MERQPDICYRNSGKRPIITIGGKVSKEKTLFSARKVVVPTSFRACK